jgi:hypothetical protein
MRVQAQECVTMCAYRGYESRRSRPRRLPYNPVDTGVTAGKRAGGKTGGGGGPSAFVN